jgi:hypothetical protein
MAAFESSLGLKLGARKDKTPVNRVVFQRSGAVAPLGLNAMVVDWFGYNVSTRPPVDTGVAGWFQIEMPRHLENTAEIKLWRTDGSDKRFEILSARLDDMLTVERPRARMLIEIGTERAEREILQELAVATENRRNHL